MFDCQVCFDTYAGVPTIVASCQVCADCVKHGIMPKFHAALKHEINYPPTWGEGIVLDPADFADFFPAPRDFLRKWEEKKIEYETPYKRRRYCPKGGEFLCVKPDDGSKPNFFCRCRRMICVPCGKDISEPLPPHICPDDVDDGDAIEPMQGVMICPNPLCKARVSLHSGCNHVICPSASCRLNFCFVCGCQADENSGHWNLGMPCPRWNAPNAPNAHYDDPDLEARLREVLAPLEQRGELQRVREVETDDLLFNDIGRQNYDARVRRVVAVMHDLPALPYNTTFIDPNAVNAEQQIRPLLLDTPIGRAMRRGRQELEAMLEVAEAYIQDFEAADPTLEVPAWLVLVTTLIGDLHMNLGIFIYRARLRQQLEIFDRRHDRLEAAYGVHQAEIYRHFPRFYEILVSYATVAVIRFLEAEIDLTEDAMEQQSMRDDVLAIERGWAAGDAVEGAEGPLETDDGMQE